MTMKNTIALLSLRHKICLWLLNLFQSIQLVALCNSRAMGEHSENSDIDLFIITKKWRLWTGRFLVTVISSLLDIRRRNTHGLSKWSPEYIKKTKDKFCLSFFITEDAMNLDPIRIENDIYLDKWIQTLVPLVNKNNTLERFQEANSKKIPSEKGNKQKFRHFIFSIPENIIKHFWLPETLTTYEKLWKPWWVVISDTMLKFHDNDQREIYRDKHTS